MKKTLLIFCVWTGLTFCAYAQNAFYDAQGFASITPAELALLVTGPKDPKQYSDEEIKTIAQAQAFLTDPFADGIDRKLLNPKLIRKIIVKLNLELHPPPAPGPFGASSGYAGLMALPSVSGSTLASFGNTASRLGSADFQTILIDATAKYLAQSFKEDVTYLYFSKFKQKLDSNAACKYLIPQTADVIKKIDPFNFKNLGDSWKAAFEKDIQNMPLSFATYIRMNAPNNAWCKKVSQSDYFKYYNYSVDILQPLVKGQHPVEVLETLDKNYSQGPGGLNGADGYKSFIHFLNILQFNLQDSTKKPTDKQYENLWLSFGQLGTLNTPLKMKYFFGLIYQQDPAFFKSGMGTELALVLKKEADHQKVIASLSQLLILLNQVEGDIKTISAARTAGTSVTGLSPAYLKTVLNIADSTNSFIKKIAAINVNGNLTAMAGKIDICLTYSDDAYKLYADITAKNYTGVIDDAGNLLAAIDKKDKVSISLVQTTLGSAVSFTTQVKTFYDSYHNTLGTTVATPLTLTNLTAFITTNQSGAVISASGVKTSLKAFISYPALAPAVQTQVDAFLTQVDQPVNDLNQLLANQAGFAASYQAVFDTYTKAVNSISVIPLSLQQLTDMVADNIHYGVIDADGIRQSIRVAVNYSGLTQPIQKQLDKALAGLDKPVDAVNKLLLKANNAQQLAVFLKTIAIIDKYGKVIAGVANAQTSDELEGVIKNYVSTSGSFAVQRNSLTTISIAAKVGASFGFEGTDRWNYFKPNIGLTVPIGIEFTWGNKTNAKTDHPFVDNDGKIHYLTGATHGLFVQIFDIAAVVNYRLSADSSSSTLPQKILLSQVFSPGVTYNLGLKNCPFDIGFGAEYTPELRKIGSDLQANSVRLFVRISWDKPLLFLSTRTEMKKGYKINPD